MAPSPESPAPLFSVVVPSWNRADLLSRTITSVVEQSCADFELIVVDDGSTDETAELVSALPDPRIRLLRQPHHGVSQARNTGAAAAGGRFLIFLDSDDGALPGWLQRLADALADEGADIAWCGGVTIHPDGREERWVPAASDTTPDTMAPRFLAGHAAIRRPVFSATGGFEPSLSFGENTELALRLVELAPPPKVVVVPEALVVVRRRPPANDEGERRAHSARYVLTRHRHSWRRFPRLWASYHTLAALDSARHGQRSQARRHFASALRADPRRPELLVRLLASMLPGVTGRLWPPKRPDCGDRSAVLFVVEAPGVGGSVRSLGTLLSHLAGVQRIVARPPGTSTSAFLAERGVVDDPIDLPRAGGHRRFNQARAAVTLWRVAARHRHRLAAIHANGLSELPLAIGAALYAGCPLVVWVHEWALSPWHRRLGPLTSRAGRRIRFAAVSDQSRDMIVAAGLARPAQVTVVANPIDPIDVRGEPPLGASGGGSVVETRWPPVAPVRLAYLGTPARYKGFHLLPDIIRAVGPDRVTWTIWAGPPTMMPEVFTELATFDPDLVAVPGKVRDVSQAYQVTDVVVVPSLRESFGRVVAEAMVAGRPVVASDLAPIRDLVGDSEAGLLVPPGDVGAAAAAIRRVAEHPELRDQLGRQGQYRGARFAVGGIVNQLRALYGIGP